MKKRKPAFNLYTHTARKTPFAQPKPVRVSTTPKGSTGITKIPLVIRNSKLRIKPQPVPINFLPKSNSGVVRKPKPIIKPVFRPGSSASSSGVVASVGRGARLSSGNHVNRFGKKPPISAVWHPNNVSFSTKKGIPKRPR